MLGAALGAALSAPLVILAQRYVSLRGAETDLFPRWYGLRALLFEGRDPYGPAVTAEIAAQTSLTAPEVARAAYGFVYPLPGALLLAPLALLPYEWAGAAWLALGSIALPAAALLVVRAVAGQPDRDAERLALPLALVSVPAAWNLALVQPGLAVVPLLALALWLWRRRPFWAGAALAGAALLKPQLAAPIAGAWGLASALHSRHPHSRRLLAGLVATALTLCVSATALLPAWPVAWLSALRSYAQVPGMEPLRPAVYLLVGAVTPASTGGDEVRRLATAGASVALALWALRAWRTASPAALPERAIVRTIVAGALLVPPAWETNALVLLIPLAVGLVGLRGCARIWFVVGSAALSLALAPLPLLFPWRSGAVSVAAYAALWALASWWAARDRRRAADRSARAPGAA